MLIVMKPQATEEDVRGVCAKIESMGFRPHPMPGAQRTAIGITGNPGPVDPAEFEDLPGVAEAIRVSKPYKLVSREVKPDDTVVRVGGVAVGAGDLILVAGPCSVESREQILATARAVARICWRDSTEQGPAMRISSPPPTGTPPTGTTVSSGFTSRLTSL